MIIEVYHKSSPANRKSILSEGLTVQTGWSYRYNHGEEVTPAIFFSYTNDEYAYDSTYEDDVYVVLIDDDTLVRDSKLKAHCMAFDNIPLCDIELIYKGTGK